MQRCVVRSSTQGGGADGQGFPPAGGASPALGGAMGHARASPRSPGAGVRDMKLMAGGELRPPRSSTSRLSMCSLSIELLVCPPRSMTFLPLRGCSDFLYVPGTNDSHIFVIRTEETIDGEVGTFCSVIDIAGKVLMPEMLFGKQRKFEGCCLIADFMKTKPAY